MADRPRISEPQWDDATLVASEEATDWPANNLLRNGRSYMWSTVDVTGTKTLTLDAGELRDVSLVILHYHNGTSAGTWQVRIADTEAELTSGPNYDSDNDPGAPYSLWGTSDMDQITWKTAYITMDAAVNGRWLRVDVSDATNPDGYFRAGRLLIADALEAELYPKVGSQFASLRDESILRRSPLGFESAVVQDPVMDINGIWLAKTKTEIERMSRIFRLSGTTRDVGIVIRPDATTLHDASPGIFRFDGDFRIRWDIRHSDEDLLTRQQISFRGV